MVEEVLGTDNIGRNGGITGLLSNNTLTREELVEYAVLSAFLPWIRSDLYGLSVE